MPELVEVERFRRMLLPLVCTSRSKKNGAVQRLAIETPSPTPPKSFPLDEELNELSNYTVKDVLRKGKLLRVDLESAKREARYLFLHMGMTGRISTPGDVPQLESLRGGDSFPPPHTHLILKSNGHVVAFSDPRRFGKVVLCSTSENEFDDLAPDALDIPGTLEGIVGKRKGIKALLLDQKAVVSGVGNWIADEVLYQSQMHPDQSMLSSEERDVICDKLRMVLATGIDCVVDGREDGLPADWIFHRRWSKSKKEVIKDAKGRRVTWVESGGRTSAIVPSIQKLKSRKREIIKPKKGMNDAKKRKSRDVVGGGKTAKMKEGTKAGSNKEASSKKAKVRSPVRAAGTRRSQRLSK